MTDENIEPVDRSIPTDQMERIRNIEDEAYVQWRVGHFDQAVKLYKLFRKLLVEIQQREDRPIHKGVPLHMIGFMSLLQDNRQNALHYFLLAYIEDTLNVAYGSEELADGAPAGNALIQLFQIDVKILGEIKRSVREKKRRGLWAEIREPEVVLAEVSKSLDMDLNNLELYCSGKPKLEKKRAIRFPWEKRVFIGGNYIFHMPILLKIKEVVLRNGYDPIIVDEFNVSEKLIHHHSLMLLHTCKYAIFEVTSSGGQFMEIERTEDYGNETLLVCNARAAQTISQMIKTTDLKLKTYEDSDRDLPSIVNDFLQGRDC